MLTHFTFNTYKGKHSLVEGEFIVFLKKHFDKISIGKGFEILECEILADHVHVLISHELPNAKVMKYLKGISAREFFKEYPSNRLVDRKLWGRSYHYRRIENNLECASVKGYIKGQKDKNGADKRYN